MLHFTKINNKSYAFEVVGALIKDNNIEKMEMTDCHVKMVKVDFLDDVKIENLQNMSEDSDHYRKARQLYDISILPNGI
jgi:hypothetical protein